LIFLDQDEEKMNNGMSITSALKEDDVLKPDEVKKNEIVERSRKQSQDEGPASRGLRAVLLLGFGGLLALLVYSGANALHTLRELHDAEEQAQMRSLERGRVLSTVVLSASVYSNNMEEVLLGPQSGIDAEMAQEMAQRSEEARAALLSYPADRTVEEQELIEQLQHYLVDQDKAFRSASDWKPEERRSRAPELVSEEIIPRRQGFVTIAQKIELLNDEQTIASKQASFVQFGNLQDQLTRFLILALVSGLLLAIGSAIYILRLERQASLRFAELVHSRGELQELSARLVDAQEVERRSISRELHDEVGQALGLLLMDAGRLSNQIGADARGQEMVQSIKTVAERTVQTVRNMALLLRPSMLDDLGLVAAVEWYAREISRRGQIEVEVRPEHVSEELPDAIKLCVYRLVQEALNNANRHAHAKAVAVELKQTPDAIRVKVTDDGSGFDPKRARGMGLLGLEERVKRLGGKIEVVSRAGMGTTVQAELPLAEAPAAGKA
jgi:signal transduction histidine kinase